MSISNALADYYMNQVLLALIVTIVLLFSAFGAGWYCGDNFDVPTKVMIE